MSERGTKALELWCRRITDGYPGVNIQNMTTSWRDGLAFCAMVHHFRPDLFDFNNLDKEDVYGNNELAFRMAEQHLGIPALLDAEDMASCTVPDRLSILTYLSQFYQTFGGSSPSRLALNRTTSENADDRIAPVSESPKPKVASRLGMRRDSCAVCRLPIFLAEKLVVAHTAYHRVCFRCARCSNQLTPGNYYETEEGQFCCETCPDEEEEEEQQSASSSMSTFSSVRKYEDSVLMAERQKLKDQDNINKSIGSNYRKSLSDEEKSEQKILEQDLNDHRQRFERNHLQSSPIPELISQTSQMRLNFISSQLNKNFSIKKSEENVDGVGIDFDSSQRSTTQVNSTFPDDDEREEEAEKEEEEEEEDYDYDDDKEKDDGMTDSNVCVDKKTLPNVPREEHLNSNELSDKYIDSCCTDINRYTKDNDVNKSMLDVSLNLRIKDNDKYQISTAIESHDICSNKSNSSTSDSTCDTKEPTNLVTGVNNDQRLSLVQQRLQVFEEPQKKLRNSSHVVHQKKDPINQVDQEKIIPDTIDIQKPEEDSIRSDVTNISLTTNVEGIDLSNENQEDYPEDLNPFKSDEEEQEVQRSHITSHTKSSTNPFDTDDDDDDGIETEENSSNKVLPPKPAARINATNKDKEPNIDGINTPVKRRLVAPKINLNPFWSDDENEADSDVDTGNGNQQTTPVPKPRTMHTSESGLSERKLNLSRRDIYASNSSITSSESAFTPNGTYRKKKPAPPPPLSSKEISDALTSPTSRLHSSLVSDNTSLRTTLRSRKAKPAPPPPMSASTPHNISANSLNLDESLEHETDKIDMQNVWENLKTNKNEANRNRQGSAIVLGEEDDASHKGFSNKSMQGKWKRKKGPAPPRPMPHKRKIKVMSMKDVKLELEEIETQQQGLEKQGVRLEQLIRDKTETESEFCSEVTDTSLSMDVEELVLELFALVNEKNELFRRQAELMLLRRQQRLEEEHADTEYQIRCLMCQPEATKTDFDKQREEALIQRLVEIVERRNEIVECLEMDRRREVEEDRSIHEQMGLYAARNKGNISNVNNDSSRSSKSTKCKIKDKVKEKKSKKSSKKDADKDVDETEVKVKRHTKRKWF